MVSASFDSTSVYDKSEFSCKVFTSTSLSAAEIDTLGRLYLSYEIIGEDGKYYYEKQKKCTLPENSSKQVAEIHLDTELISTHLFLLRIVLRNEGGECIAENEYMFTKEMHLGSVFTGTPNKLRLKQDGNHISVRNIGENVLWYLFITNGEALPQKDYLYLDKNYFCLIPGEERAVKIHSDSGELAGKIIELESFLYKENFMLH